MRDLTALSFSQMGRAGSAEVVVALGMTPASGASGNTAATPGAVAAGSFFLEDFLGLALRFLIATGLGAGLDTDGACCFALERAFGAGDGATSARGAFSAIVGALGAVTRLGLTTLIGGAT